MPGRRGLIGDEDLRQPVLVPEQGGATQLRCPAWLDGDEDLRQPVLVA